MSGGLATAVDDLYRDVVIEPELWGKQAFAEWLEMLALDAGEIGREEAKHLRRAVRMAIKLQTFWSAADAARRRAEPSWRARVDIAVGVPAWRPALELAMLDLYANPTEDSFDDVRDRFRVVNGTPWLEGTSFASWRAESGTGDAR